MSASTRRVRLSASICRIGRWGWGRRSHDQAVPPCASCARGSRSRSARGVRPDLTSGAQPYLTCTTDCAEAFPLFYERCWPEMNWILQGNGTKDGLKFIPDPDGPTAASQLQVDHFQMQCAAVMTEFETPEDIARVTSQDDTEPITSCLPLITRLETEFEQHCC